jgi:hypothetical protein
VDCGTRMGGQDGRSDGGAVSGSRAAVSFLVLLASVSLTACSKEKAKTGPDDESLLQAVPPADMAKIRSVQEGKHWSNPYLVIRPAAVGLLTGVAANEEQILKPEDTLKALAQLPASAWPYGRAVAILVDAKPSSSEEDKIALRRNRGIVAGELQNAHVAINWIPSS